MKSISDYLPLFYVIYAKDTDGDIWSFLNVAQQSAKAMPIYVETADDLPHYSKRDVVEIQKAIEADPTMWVVPIPGIRPGEHTDTLRLRKSSLRVESVSCVCTHML